MITLPPGILCGRRNCCLDEARGAWLEAGAAAFLLVFVGMASHRGMGVEDHWYWLTYPVAPAGLDEVYL